MFLVLRQACNEHPQLCWLYVGVSVESVRDHFDPNRDSALHVSKVFLSITCCAHCSSWADDASFGSLKG